MTQHVQTSSASNRPAAMPLVLEDQERTGSGLWAEAFKRLMRNRMAVAGMIIIGVMVFCAIFADAIAPKHFADQVRTDNNAIPSWMPLVFTSIKPIGVEGGYAQINDTYPLGADYVGRDIFSRIIYGTRISLSVALIGPVMALMLGLLAGTIAGFYGGWRDQVIMRFVDLMYGFPTLLLIILMMAFFRSSFAESQPGTFAYNINQIDAAFGGLLFIFIGIGITSWMTMARLARGQVLAVKQREYVIAAESIGLAKPRILLRHVVPNILGPLIVAETLAIPTYISFEAFLSFIGLGVNRPTPSWGAMISDGAASIRSYPNQAIFPALALALAMFAFNFLGDGLRDALDPRLRGVD